MDRGIGVCNAVVMLFNHVKSNIREFSKSELTAPSDFGKMRTVNNKKLIVYAQITNIGIEEASRCTIYNR